MWFSTIRWWEYSLQGRWSETLKRSNLIITELTWLEAAGEQFIDRYVVLKDMFGEKDFILWKTSSTLLKTIYWIHNCLVHLDALTPVPSLLVYLQVHFLFFVNKSRCVFWDHFTPSMKDTATRWSLISVDI